MKAHVSLFATLFALAAASPAWAVGKRFAGTSAAQFLKVGAGARAAGMGEAFTAVTDGAESIYWNPAGLNRIGSRAFSAMHSVYLKEINYDFASYAQRIGSWGVVGVGVQYLGGAALDQVDENDRNVGTFKPYDMAVSVGWAGQSKEFGDGDFAFSFGAAGKLIRSRVIETAQTGAADLGIQWKFRERFGAGIAAQNMGGRLKYKDESDPLPFTVKAGVSCLLGSSLTLAADAVVPRDNDVSFAAGAEYAVRLTPGLSMTVRGGYNTRAASGIRGLSSVSAGGGLLWKHYRIDFAWVPYGGLGADYRASLSARF